MTVLPDGAAAVWAVATRISVLDSAGFVDPGAAVYVTDTLIKCTITPVMETGDDIAIKNAAGNMAVFAKHGDMPKYKTVAMELATPDPQLEAALCGGTVYTDTTAALGAPSGLTITPQTTLGTLVAATYGYRATYYNAYGESVATNDVSAAVASGTTGLIVVNVGAMPAGALGVRVYGRTIGGEQFIGSYPNIGSQATSAASGTGSPTSLAVTALTKGIPPGTTFQIAGDTNTPKIVFTTTAYANPGAVALPVSVSQSITTTIAAGNITPVFVDTGAIVPSGYVPTTDTTAGPGAVGYQEPAVGPVANPNGVSIEFFEKAIVNGFQAAVLPYYRIVLPRVANMHVMPRDVTNANLASLYEGQAFQNPNWGSGAFGDWQFDSTKTMQRARCGAQIVPLPTTAGVPLVQQATV